MLIKKKNRIFEIGEKYSIIVKSFEEKKPKIRNKLLIKNFLILKKILKKINIYLNNI